MAERKSVGEGWGDANKGDTRYGMRLLLSEPKSNTLILK